MTDEAYDEFIRPFRDVRQRAAGARNAPASVQLELVAVLADLPGLLDLLDSQRDDIEVLERQCGELLDRLVVTEFALQSSNESRDRATRALADLSSSLGSSRDSDP